MKEQVEDLHPCTLKCVDELSAYLEQDAMAGHDGNEKMIFKWTFGQDGEPVQVHMLKTDNGKYALACADFGQDGELAKKWRKKNKGHFAAMKRIVCKYDNHKSIYVGEGAVDELF